MILMSLKLPLCYMRLNRCREKFVQIIEGDSDLWDEEKEEATEEVIESSEAGTGSWW